MSYEIIKGLTYEKKTGDVYLRASSNNIQPRTFEKRLWGNIKEIESGRYQNFEELELSLIKDYIANAGIDLVIKKYQRAVAKTKFEYPDLFKKNLYHDEETCDFLGRKVLANIGKNTKGEFIVFVVGKNGESDIGAFKGKTKYGYRYTPIWHFGENQLAHGTRIYKTFEDALITSQEIFLGEDLEFKIFEKEDLFKYLLRAKHFEWLLKKLADQRAVLKEIKKTDDSFVLVIENSKLVIPKKLFDVGDLQAKTIREVKEFLMRPKYDYVSKLKAL